MRTGAYVLLALLAALAVAGWLLLPAGPQASERVPIRENDPAFMAARPDENMLNPGTSTKGDGTPSKDPGTWPGFRGPLRDAKAEGAIASEWPESGPPVLWEVPALGEGHAGAAIRGGCVYLIDYDEKKKEDAIRCLSLGDGRDIWRYTYSVKVKRNHGMSRTVPAVTDRHVVTLGPRCHVVCLDARTGELRWRKDLVREYGTAVPEWHAGQCPLVGPSGHAGGEGKACAIIAPGGSALMVAFDLETGEPVWETPNPDGWKMTHSSVTPVEFEGKTQYVWCADRGVVGIDAETGRLLWKFTGWSIKVATVPSPVNLGDGRILFTGGYGSGAMMVRLERSGDGVAPRELFRTKPKVFGSDQQTPVYLEGHVYGVIPGGVLVCMTPEGEALWKDKAGRFGLGPYMVAGGKLLVLDDHPPELWLFEVDPTGAKVLARFKVSDGSDAWAPMALAGGKLVLRDSRTILCLDLR
jgi:outer membrane protein assembly factor BamB